MVLLIFSRLAIGVKKIGNGRAPQHDGFLKDVLEHLAQRDHFFFAEAGADAHGMNLRAPQTFIRVDVANAAEHALIE